MHSITQSSSSHVIRSRLSAVAGALALATTGCIPIPISHMVQVTPTVSGTLHTSEGSPVRNARVAVTGSSRDKGCTRSGGVGLTDAMGRFYLPAVDERRHIFWLTLMESFGRTVYWLCADPNPSTSSASPPDSHPPRLQILGYASGDSLACLTFELQGAAQVACNGLSEMQIVTEGTWTDGALSGTYRVLLPPLAGWGARAVVQWITPAPGPHTRGTLHAQAELPTGNGVRPEETRIRLYSNGWHVVLLSVEKTRWNNDIWLTFELGGPGAFRQVSDP